MRTLKKIDVLNFLYVAYVNRYRIVITARTTGLAAPRAIFCKVAVLHSANGAGKFSVVGAVYRVTI